MATSPQSVSFPSTDPAHLPAPVTHLPFRRISLPNAPTSSFLSAQHRQSTASIASVEIQEEPVARHHRRRSFNRRHSRTPTPVETAREAKRAKVVREFWDTERSYVEGLDLVHDHFLTPIIASLDTSRPLLTRAELTTTFSNFIDIWNFHHAFFGTFTALIHPIATQLDASHSPPNPNPPPLSSLLLSHFPYLSLYNPFITTFPSSISFLVHPPASFAAFLRAQERDPRCGKLRLTDWLLTIVQRCPRYVLLLKELMDVEKKGESERDKLGKVLALVEKVTSSLNTSLHAHAHTLALLALQRATVSLPPHLHFIQPGRRLIFRCPLVIDSGGVAIHGPGIGRRRNDRICEFLLFDDVLVWLDCEPSAPRDSHSFSPCSDAGSERHMYTYRNHLSLVDVEAVLDPSHHPLRLEVLSPGGSFAVYAVPSSPWQSPQRISFSHSEPGLDTTQRDRITPLPPSPNDTLHTFLHLLRQARSALLARDPSVALRGVRMRGVLWAEAYEPSEVGEPDSQLEHGDGPTRQVENPAHGQGPTPGIEPKQGHVERPPVSVWPQRAPLPFLPPVWVPDAKTDACMRCTKPFGFVKFTMPLLISESFSLPSFPAFEWGRHPSQEISDMGELVIRDASSATGGLSEGSEGKDDGNARGEGQMGGSEGMWRRRHHCRLCGRVVCAECSGRTFYITDPSSPQGKKTKAKPARACNECYEAAFPLVSSDNSNLPTLSHNGPSATLLGIPEWLSTPVLTESNGGADALMAMTLSPSVGRIATNGSPSKSRPSSSAGMNLNPSHGGMSAIPGLTHDPGEGSAQHAHPASHLSRISSGDAPSSSSPSLSPAPSHFTASDNKVVDVPTLRVVGDPSAGDSFATHADEDEQHHEDTPVFRISHATPASRPIRIRHSSRSRPRSYHDILEDFQAHARGESVASSVVASSLGAVAEEQASRVDGEHCEEIQGDDHEDEEVHDEPQHKPRERELTPQHWQEKREDTARRKKRFSLPAVAVQTVPVVARSAPVGGTHGGWGVVKRRLSLVLGARAVRSGEKGKGKRRNGVGERSRDGTTQSSLPDDQSLDSSSREAKVSKNGESSAARVLLDVFSGRRGKDKM